MIDTTYIDFGNWIEAILSNDLACEIAAYNFNLYEGAEAYAIELIGASEYDSEDSDWACDDVLGADAPRFQMPNDLANSNWETALVLVKTMLGTYLNSDSSGASTLRKSVAVTVGFVDGDLELVWCKAEPSVQADAYGAA